MRCLRVLEGNAHVFYPEFRIFTGWYFLNYPNHFKEEGKKSFDKLKGADPKDYKFFRNAIIFMKANPDILYPPPGEKTGIF